jgi:hypothetical protein
VEDGKILNTETNAHFKKILSTKKKNASVHYKMCLVMFFRETINVYSENDIKIYSVKKVT